MKLENMKQKERGNELLYRRTPGLLLVHTAEYNAKGVHGYHTRSSTTAHRHSTIR